MEAKEVAPPPDVSSLRLFFQPRDRLRMTVGQDRSYPTVRPTWARPQSEPNRWLALLDAKGDEIVMIEEPSRLDAESRKAVDIELDRRYLSSKVKRVESVRSVFGATYWKVETHRGERDFVTQNLQENAQWVTDDQLILNDVDGNRFEVDSVRALDVRSQKLLHAIL